MTRPGIARRFSYVERANAGSVSATLRIKQEKAPDELGSCVRRLMAIVYASVFWQSIVRTVRSVAARIKQLQRKNAVSIAFERW